MGQECGGCGVARFGKEVQMGVPPGLGPEQEPGKHGILWELGFLCSVPQPMWDSAWMFVGPPLHVLPMVSSDWVQWGSMKIQGLGIDGVLSGRNTKPMILFEPECVCLCFYVCVCMLVYMCVFMLCV